MVEWGRLREREDNRVRGNDNRQGKKYHTILCVYYNIILYRNVLACRPWNI